MSDLESPWIAAENAIVAGDAETLERLLREHGPMFRGQRPPSSWSGGLMPNYSGGRVWDILVREHHFTSADELVKHIEAMKRADAPVTRFEAAADAVVTGNVGLLREALRLDPELVRTRSTRQHQATLLHYVGANGVEGWRQRTPSNAVEVAEVLLDAGAEVDAMADMYGGSTTLGLAATSIHPLLAGVQNDLIQVLLDRGAAMDHPTGAGNNQGIVNGCLANGRPGAARYLADRGARLDLEGAAGEGQMEVVRRFFNDDSSLRPEATPTQMKSGFQWACEYGRTEVVEFLLRRGIEIGEIHRGQTGLHWSAYGGHLETVRALLERGAPVTVRDEQWNNTPLGWAIHGWANPPNEIPGGGYYEIVAHLVAAGATVEPQWISNEAIRADAQMRTALRLD